MTAGGSYDGGGHTCPSCGLWISVGAIHLCQRAVPFYPFPFYQAPAYQTPVYAPTGWVCPRCGIVHAPTVLRCECEPPKTGDSVAPLSVLDAPSTKGNNDG